MIPIYKPFLKNYKKSAMKAIENGWISNHGINIKLASEKLNEILNVKYSILMNNGTAATHCLYIALKYFLFYEETVDIAIVPLTTKE